MANPRQIGLDRVMEVAAAPGNGTLVTLGGAVLGYRTFASVMVNADSCAYFMEAIDGNGTPTGLWERGFGNANGSPIGIQRAQVIDGSSGPGAKVNFTTTVRIGIAPMSDTVGFLPQPGGRLSLVSGSPVADSGTGGSGTVYYMPYLHDRIVLNNFSYGLHIVQFSQVSLALTGLAAGTAYDVFGYLIPGISSAAATMGLETNQWTNSTARASNLQYINGFLCKNSDGTRRYLGSFYVSATATTYDYANGNATSAGGKRFLWNMYNRVSRNCSVWDGTNSWNPTATGWQPYRGQVAPNNCVEFFRGATEDAVSAVFVLSGNLPQGTQYYSTIGLDSTTSGPNASSCGIFSNNAGGTASMNVNVGASYGGTPGNGYHYLSMVINPSATSVGMGATYGLPALNATMMA